MTYSPTSNALADELLEMFPTRNAILTSRCTTALYLILAAIRITRGPGEVVVPASVCPTVPLAVLYAGLTPRFCDVELDTYSLSARTVAPCLSDKTKAVIVVYLFGKSFDIRTLRRMISSRDAFIIEDLALSIGGTFEEKLLGSVGDCAVLSFNDTKIVKGTAGAAVVRDSALFQNIESISHQLPRPPPPWRVSELNASFYEFTRGLYNLMRARDIDYSVNYMLQVADYYRPLFLYKRPFPREQIADLVAQLRSLPDQLYARGSVYKSYKSHLSEAVRYMRFSPTDMCWRLPMLLDNHRQQVDLIARMRRNGILISNHYFPASYLFGDSSAVNARKIGLRAVNFWVDEKADRRSIPSISGEINELR